MVEILRSFLFSLGFGILPYLVGFPISKTGLGFLKLILSVACVSILLFYLVGYKYLITIHAIPSLLMILSALLIGNIVFSMLLGHWYLVVPKMDESVIERVFWFFWPTLIARMAYSLVPILSNQTNWVDFLGNAQSWEWIIFTMRYLWGYVILIILGILTRKLIRMRSLQSATGVLYIMVFFVFIGEIIGMYMNDQFSGLN